MKTFTPHTGAAAPPRRHAAVPPGRRRRHRAALLALLLAAAQLAPPAAMAQVRLPALGESASADLSVSAERRIGEQIMREGRRDPAFLDDPVLVDYLQSIWQPLVAAARERGEIDADTDRAFAWEAFLLGERSVNAFALPGGYVGVHLGLVAITGTRDQLASVLAHELSHVTQRHIARSIASSQRSSMVSVAAILLGLLAASRGGGADVANAAIVGGQAAAIQGQLNFSRDMEREADRIGFGLMGSAGFSTAGMAEMFDRLDVATRLNDTGGFPYLRSHPLTVDRISEARSRTLLPGSRAQGPSLAHTLMQARARVLMDTSAEALQKLVAGATSSNVAADRIAAAYAGALAASRLKDGARAEAASDQALRLAAGTGLRLPQADLALQLLRAEVRLARGDAAGAVRALAEAPAGADRPKLLMSAQAALEMHRQRAGGGSGNGPVAGSADDAGLRRATESLQTWVADQPNDAAAWEALSATAEALGMRLRALRAGAEAQAARGDTGGAIDRMRGAQAAARNASGAQDFIEASVIDARLRQLQALRRQHALDMREAGGSTGRSAPREPGENANPPIPP